MSDEKSKPESKTKGSGPGALGLVLPALVAGLAAFGGARVAGAHHAPGPVAAPEHAESKAPGPTLALDPFLVTVPDAAKKVHAMKVTIALEFEATGGGHEESLPKGLAPRIRDASLGYFRKLTYEDVLDPTATDKMRAELLERARAVGVDASRVLVTDLVIQ